MLYIFHIQIHIVLNILNVIHYPYTSCDVLHSLSSCDVLHCLKTTPLPDDAGKPGYYFDSML